MPFVEGFLAAVPVANRAAFLDHAKRTVPLFAEFGATRIVDTWGDDVPEGKITDFRRAVAGEAGEAVSFGWMEYPDRATRDAASRRMMEDPRMRALGDMPFDGRRMVYGGFEPVVDEGPGGPAGYVEGFVLAVPTAAKARFVEHCLAAAPLFLGNGATRHVECWGEDVPHGERTDFHRAVDAREDETVVFSWIEWPDRAARDAGQAKVMAAMETEMKDNPMPFDGQRMIYGGFEILNDAREQTR